MSDYSDKVANILESDEEFRYLWYDTPFLAVRDSDGADGGDVARWVDDTLKTTEHLFVSDLSEAGADKMAERLKVRLLFLTVIDKIGTKMASKIGVEFENDDYGLHFANDLFGLRDVGVAAGSFTEGSVRVCCRCHVDESGRRSPRGFAIDFIPLNYTTGASLTAAGMKGMKVRAELHWWDEFHERLHACDETITLGDLLESPVRMIDGLFDRGGLELRMKDMEA